MVSRKLLTPVEHVTDRSYVVAATCMAIVVNDLISAHRWALRAFEIEREKGDGMSGNDRFPQAICEFQSACPVRKTRGGKALGRPQVIRAPQNLCGGR